VALIMHGSSSLLRLAAILEVVTGLALIGDPSLVARLLLGDGVSGAGTALGRVAGVGLLSLGSACWPSRAEVELGAPRRAMLTYNALIAAFLLYLEISNERTGKLLWPAVAIHGVLTLLLGRAWITAPRSTLRNKLED
jgi:hypothetical protein